MERKWHEVQKNGYILIVNEGGKNIAYSPASGIRIIEADGFAFKDLNGNGVLDPYEDWRLPVEDRIRDLVSRMSIEQIAGLMLYSSHQSVSVPDPNNAFTMRFAGTYRGGNAFDGEKDNIWDLTDQQKEFLEKDNVRHILMTSVENSAAAAKWNNNIQSYCESVGLGIPANISSDPRHGASSNGEFFVGANGSISQWPSTLGLAASFDPDLTEQFGGIMSEEYRGLGITTALSPQIDLASEPRWNRFNGTFGSISDLSVDMARAYVDGCQTTEGKEDGWGEKSVNAMVKHWPGGGTGEGGRDAHYCYGMYSVYPGNNAAEHLRPFTEGAFRLKGATHKAAAVMPYYTISTGFDKKYGENVGNSYNKYIITDLLRTKYGFDGVICTDWGITKDCTDLDDFARTSWGVAHLSENERHYKALMAGVDQFGGNNEAGPVIAAYKMGCASMGEEKMRARMEASASRLLANIFRPGLFEDPYTDPDESAANVGCAAFMQAGYEAQKRSIVMLKNRSVNGRKVLPLADTVKVYIPDCPETVPAGMAARFTKPGTVYPAHPWVSDELASKYVQITHDPDEADAAVVFLNSPATMKNGYDPAIGYVPVTLQYRPYTAATAREQSIAQGDPFSADAPNRSYRGRTMTTGNEAMLDTLVETRQKMGDKPVIVALDVTSPMVMKEVEPLADAILMGFELQKQAYLEMVAGKDEPNGLLPFQLPANMETVEAHCEDLPGDMECHVDTEGNAYDFGFGMNFAGVIHDARTEKYCGK